MMEVAHLRPGEEIDIGAAHGWRYFVRHAEGRNLFWVLRRSLGFKEFNPDTETLGVWPTQKEAEDVARWAIRGLCRGHWVFWGR